MAEAEKPDRLDPRHRVTVDDVRQLMGASTPHFALQLRNRIRKLIAGLAVDDPARRARRAGDRAARAAGVSPARCAGSRPRSCGRCRASARTRSRPTPTARRGTSVLQPGGRRRRRPAGRTSTPAGWGSGTGVNVGRVTRRRLCPTLASRSGVNVGAACLRAGVRRRRRPTLGDQRRARRDLPRRLDVLPVGTQRRARRRPAQPPDVRTRSPTQPGLTFVRRAAVSPADDAR